MALQICCKEGSFSWTGLWAVQSVIQFGGKGCSLRMEYIWTIGSGEWLADWSGGRKGWRKKELKIGHGISGKRPWTCKTGKEMWRFLYHMLILTREHPLQNRNKKPSTHNDLASWQQLAFAIYSALLSIQQGWSSDFHCWKPNLPVTKIESKPLKETNQPFGSKLMSSDSFNLRKLIFD